MVLLQRPGRCEKRGSCVLLANLNDVNDVRKAIWVESKEWLEKLEGNMGAQDLKLWLADNNPLEIEQRVNEVFGGGQDQVKRVWVTPLMAEALDAPFIQVTAGASTSTGGGHTLNIEQFNDGIREIRKFSHMAIRIETMI